MICGRTCARRGRRRRVRGRVPISKGFFLRFREAEVGFSAPQLLGAEVLVGLEQFVGAHEAHRVVGVGGHGVLAAFAAGEGEERDTCAQAAREVGEQRAIFIVRMSDDEHHAGGGSERLESLLELGLAAVFREGKRVGCGSVYRQQRVAAVAARKLTALGAMR